LFITSLIALTTTIIFSHPGDFHKLIGPYLGQKPPGLTPEIFAPGMVSMFNISIIRTGIDFSQAMVSKNKIKRGGKNDRETGKLS
jgi:hypothetical protein